MWFMKKPTVDYAVISYLVVTVLKYRLLHYARKQMKVLVNNKSELSSLLKSKIKIGKLMWQSAPRT
jgi:hypothetical protein